MSQEQDNNPIAQEKETYVVTINPENLDDLTRWVTDRNGTVQPYDLIRGAYGSLRKGQEMPSLNFYLQMQVARTNPSLRCPGNTESHPRVWDEIAALATDSYEWMHEGYFDPTDLPDILEALEPALQPRDSIAMEEAEAKVGYLRTDRRMENLPDWEHMNNSQKALIIEAFNASAPEWQHQARLNSYHQEVLAQLIKGL